MRRKTYTIKHKQEVVAEYKYNNGAHIRILAVSPPMNGCDTLLFHLAPDPKNGKPLQFYLRPDEALLIIRLLADAVNRTTKGYAYGLQSPKAKYRY